MANSISTIFISFYIWKSSTGLHQLLLYHLWLFALIPVSATLGSWLAKHISPSFSYILGLVANILLLTSAVVFSHFFVNTVWLFGVLTGVSVGLIGLSANLITEEVAHSALERINAVRGFVSAAVTLVIPASLAMALFLGLGYSPLFIIGSVFLLCSAVAAALSVSPAKPSSFQPLPAILAARSNPNRGLLFGIYLLHGIRDGVLWGLGPVVALQVMGGVKSWGIYILAFSALSLGINYLLTRVLNWHTNHSFIIGSGIFFSIACVIFGSNFGFYSFLWYSVFLTVDLAITGSAFMSATTRIVQSDLHYTKYKDEYFSLLEYPVGIGRVLPMAVLLFAGSSLDNNLTLRILIIAIGTISTLIFYLLNQTKDY